MALDKLVVSGAMSLAQAESQKKKTGQAIKIILQEWDAKVQGIPNFTYKDALKAEQAELTKAMGGAKNVGKALRAPTNKARRAISLAVQKEAGKSLGNANPASNTVVEKGVKEAALEADYLVRVGVAGKVAYAGLVLLQIGYAAEQDKRADEFETLLPDNITKTIAGLAIGGAIGVAVAPLVPFGAVGAILASILIGAAVDEVVAGVYEVVKKELGDREPPDG